MATIISDVNDLQDIDLDLTADYELANDIEASGFGFAMLAGDFTGSLDGMGFNINDLTITVLGGGTQNGALFRTNKGTIKNLRLVDCVIDVTSTTLNVGVASLVVINDVAGVIENVSATGTVTGAGVAGGSVAAGLVVVNDGQIDDSYSEVIVSLNAPTPRVGGFVVENNGIINNSYARGNVTAVGANSAAGGFMRDTWAPGVTTNCYSTGIPTAADIGGFCQEDNGGTITACFWDIETSGTAVSDGGTGKTTAQMKTKSTFTDVDWDFIILWGINGITNDGYAFFWTMPPEPMPDAPRRTVAVQDKITLESIRNIEMAAGGRCHINEEGKFVYRSRYARNA